MTEDVIQERLRQSCVELLGPGGELGSGYVIAVDRIGTANHVVKDWADDDWYDVAVGWGREYRQPGQARVLKRDVTSDAAILELRGVTGLSPLPVLRSLPKNGRPWWGFGFPAVAVRDGVPTGVPTGGTVVDAGWSNAREVKLLLLRSAEASTGRATPLNGYSGSPVTVNGALVGHLVEQFNDPDDISRPALGFAKACPISVIVALLEQEGRAPAFESDTPDASESSSRPRDLDIAAVFAWCDREAVKHQIEDWVIHASKPAAGLLCVVGASNCRHQLLISRVVDEIQRDSEVSKLGVMHFKERLDFGKAGELEKRMLKFLGIDGNAKILNAAEFRRGARSLVLCLYLDVSRWSQADAEHVLGEISSWLAKLAIPASRLLLVLNLRYERRPLFDRIFNRERPAIHRMLGDAHRKLMNVPGSALARCSLGDTDQPLLELADYTLESVRLFQEIPHVRDVMRSFLDEDFFEWFGDRRRSYAEIEKYLKKKHPILQYPQGSAA